MMSAVAALLAFVQRAVSRIAACRRLTNSGWVSAQSVEFCRVTGNPVYTGDLERVLVA